MPRPARPTLRCLKEDLAEDWDTVEHRRAALNSQMAGIRVHELGHPVIRHAAALFAGAGDGAGEIARESISGLTDPPWWKLKTGRWRGAVYEDSDGQAWLCAAGLRRENEATDFYKDFSSKINSSGPTAFLPSGDDRDLLRLEAAAERVASWERSVVVSVIETCVAAKLNGSAAVDIPSPSGDETVAATVSIAIDTLGGEWDAKTGHEEPAGVAVEIKIENWEDTLVRQRLVVLVCAAISPGHQAWDVAPYADAPCLQATITLTRLRQLEVATELPDPVEGIGQPGVISALTHAHYVQKQLIAGAAVEGSAVLALCGLWFVPTQDTNGLPVCAPCEAAHTAVTAMRVRT